MLIAGVIYGGTTGFRHKIRLIEGEATVVPGLPFVIQLDELQVEEYQQEEFPRTNLATLPMKTQDSQLTLLKDGISWRSMTVAPGRPARVDGITLLPALNDIGWYFELVVVDALGREKTIPVRPWAPPLIQLGDKRVMTHSLVTGDSQTADFFTIENNEVIPLGTVGREQPLEIEGSTLSLGPVKRYTGIQVYNRPQEPILVWGCILMFLGLVWHFYFRHRDRKREGKSDA